MTDRDRQDYYGNRPTALCTVVHRTLKTFKMFYIDDVYNVDY